MLCEGEISSIMLEILSHYHNFSSSYSECSSASATHLQSLVLHLSFLCGGCFLGIIDSVNFSARQDMQWQLLDTVLHFFPLTSNHINKWGAQGCVTCWSPSVMHTLSSYLTSAWLLSFIACEMAVYYPLLLCNERQFLPPSPTLAFMSNSCVGRLECGSHSQLARLKVTSSYIKQIETCTIIIIAMGHLNQISTLYQIKHLI